MRVGFFAGRDVFDARESRESTQMLIRANSSDSRAIIYNSDSFLAPFFSPAFVPSFLFRQAVRMMIAYLQCRI
jgi:hypothetical protein